MAPRGGGPMPAYRSAPPRRKGSVVGWVIGILGLAATGFVVLILIGAAAERSPTQPRAAAAQPNRPVSDLYSIGVLPRTRCQVGTVDLHNSAQVSRFYTTMGGCLNRLWGPLLTRAGYSFTAPSFVITSGHGRGACGDYPTSYGAPYYCNADATIYGGTTAYVKGYAHIPGAKYTGSLAQLVAHEYGHHIQHLTGIRSTFVEGTPGNGPGELMSRRLELQAQCFSTQELRAFAHSFPIKSPGLHDILLFNSYLGDRTDLDLHDHGTNQSNMFWVRRGWYSPGLSNCDTWTASPSSEQ
jgi:uncharacterized protein